MDGEHSRQSIAPLQGSELELWLAGLEDFDQKRYWHAHEDWEDLWNAHKRRQAPQSEILFVQGMIQTAALLLKSRASENPRREEFTTQGQHKVGFVVLCLGH